MRELQQEISGMKFSVSKGCTVIAYTGTYNAIASYKVEDKVSQFLGDSAIYISDLPAGELLNDDGFKEAMESLIGEENISRICSGYINGEYTTRYAGGSCSDKGVLKDILSLDDFVSKKTHGRNRRSQ